jgi:hypothetical protein
MLTGIPVGQTLPLRNIYTDFQRMPCITFSGFIVNEADKIYNFTQ